MKVGNAWSLAKFLMFSVPQGSVLGPLLFLIYLLPLHRIVMSHGLQLDGYADDNQLFITIKDPANPWLVASQCARIQECIDDVNSWMMSNMLKLNNDKTEILVLGTDQRVGAANIRSLQIGGVTVNVSARPIGNLGSVLDSQLDMSAQITKTVQSANYHLRNIGKVRRRLTTDATKQLVQSLVISRLDYCNGLLYGVDDKHLKRLRKVHHQAARLITLTKPRDHMTPVMKQLHWLPIQKRIEFKIMCNTYKSLTGTGPRYLAELLVPYIPSRTLRSAKKELLVVPKVNLEVGNQSFRWSAPTLWNSLPVFIKNAKSFSSFKTSLKTHYFNQVYS